MENGKTDGIGHIAYRTPDTHDQTPPPSNQQSATRNCSVKRCKNSLAPNNSCRMCLEHREKEK